MMQTNRDLSGWIEWGVAEKQRKAPLCKGSWLAAGKTEGLSVPSFLLQSLSFVALLLNSSWPEPVPFVSFGDISPHCGESPFTQGSRFLSSWNANPIYTLTVFKLDDTMNLRHIIQYKSFFSYKCGLNILSKIQVLLDCQAAWQKKKKSANGL